MILRSDADAPSIDRGVLARLRRLDPDLRLTWHRYAIDVLTGEVILGPGGKPVLDPAWYLWRRDRGSNAVYHFVMSFPAREGFGHREVAGLESDAGRLLDPKEIRLRHEARVEARRRKELERIRQKQRDKIAANRRRIHDLVFEGRLGVRDGRPFSYPGQPHRSTPGLVAMSAREDGWELPEE